VTVSLDSLLVSYYDSKAGIAGSGSTSTAATAAESTRPTPPWDQTTTSSTSSTTASTAASTNAALSAAQNIIDGQPLINPSATTLTTTSKNPEVNSDYQNLFALYKGLSSLQTIATAASAKGLSNSQLTTLQKAFASGLSQVQTFINSEPFDEFQVGDGTVTAKDQSTAAVPKTPTTYTTGLTAATADTVLPQLQGDVQFSATISLPNGSTPTTVNFNLADMGDTPRTLGNVVTYLNSQLAAAGSDITFGDKTVTTPAVTKTNTIGKTSTVTTITAATSQVELQVLGNSLETVSFSAASTSPAVYVAASSTAPTVGYSTTSSTSSTTASTTSSKTSSTTSSTTSSAATTTSQVLAFDPTGANAVNTTNDELWSDNLPSTATVDATATGPDGSVYVLANLSGTTDGQSIQGTQAAALLKYDSAGDLVYERQLGSLNASSGYALAVSPDGSQVAIAGSTTSPTVLGASTNAYDAATQSTVAVYDASSGDQLWTQTQKASGDNQINGVAFGSDNSVYVVGQATGSLTGASSQGGIQEGYVEGFTATPKTTTSFVTPTVGSTASSATTQTVTWTATNSFTTEFGTTGVNRATGVAVNGSSLYVTSVQNGDAVVSQYTTSSIGAPSLTASQDLGALDGGNLAGIVVNADGSISVAGTTSNGNLNGGTVTSAYTGGQNAFVAQLSSSLDPQYLDYVDEGNATTATGITVSDGETYITGQVSTGADPANGQISEDGYVASLDPTTGQVSWSQTFQGTNGNAAPVGVAVSDTGSSVLSLLGLPDGEINQATSQTLVANTSLQAGDKFYIQVGTSSPVPITITASDTYATLAKKIEAASGNRVVAKTVTIAGGTALDITPLNANSTEQVTLSAGPIGEDALGPLGLKAGLITNASTSSNKLTSTSDLAASTTNTLKAAYNISLPTTLNLDSTTNIAAALSQVKTATSEVQDIFYNMTTPPASTTASGATSNTALVAIYQSQAAGYASALARLEGSSTSTTSTTATSLIGLAAGLKA
jgi:hypothetical protein